LLCGWLGVCGFTEDLDVRVGCSSMCITESS
jgi:hypothetical protein